jgi:hypothetical protein
VLGALLAQAILGNNATIKEAVEKGTRKGACTGEQGKAMRGSRKSKEKKKDAWINHVHKKLECGQT